MCSRLQQQYKHTALFFFVQVSTKFKNGHFGAADRHMHRTVQFALGGWKPKADM